MAFSWKILPSPDKARMSIHDLVWQERSAVSLVWGRAVQRGVASSAWASSHTRAASPLPATDTR